MTIIFKPVSNSVEQSLSKKKDFWSIDFVLSNWFELTIKCWAKNCQNSLGLTAKRAEETTTKVFSLIPRLQIKSLQFYCSCKVVGATASNGVLANDRTCYRSQLLKLVPAYVQLIIVYLTDDDIR